MEVVGRGRHSRWLALAAALAAGLALVAAAPAPAAAASTCPSGHVALTFDDGPGPHTPAVLDVLERHDAAATFFVLGHRTRSAPGIVTRQAREGHVVANHSERHREFTRLSNAQIRESVRATDAAIRDAGVEPISAVRPPYGATNSRVRGVLRDAGYAHVLWSVDPQDWRGHASSTIVRHVTSRLAPGAVILLHDYGGHARNTIGALPRIIDTAHSRGYCFGVLDDRGRVVAPTPPEPPPPELDDVAARGTEAACPEPVPAGFTDLDDLAEPTREGIDCLVGFGLARGTSATAFQPREPVHRVDAAVLLSRLLTYDAMHSGLVLPWPEGEEFTDVVDLSAERRDAVRTLSALGVTNGTGDGTTFSPFARVTRRDMAVMLSRLQDATVGPDAAGEGGRFFLDVPPELAGAAEINALADRGIVQGNANRTFGWSEAVRRDELALLLARHLDEHVEAGRLPAAEPVPVEERDEADGDEADAEGGDESDEADEEAVPAP